MDFIETWFGLSPDGGDGTSEALYLAGAFAILVVLLTAMRRSFVRRWRSRSGRAGRES